MKPRFFFPTVSLIAMIVLSACAPAATSSPVVAVPTDSVVIPGTELPTNPSVPEATAVVATAEPAVQAIATSRGPDLEATDPTTVSLAAGQLQLIEFFRFTWGTCRAMAPMVHGLEAEYFGKIKFSYLDADDPQTDTFKQALGFYYQPEFYLLDADGNVIKKLVGYTSEDDFRSMFDENLQ